MEGRAPFFGQAASIIASRWDIGVRHGFILVLLWVASYPEVVPIPPLFPYDGDSQQEAVNGDSANGPTIPEMCLRWRYLIPLA